MKGKDAPLTHKASRKRIQSGKKTVLYFHTPSCGACKMQGPIIDKIKKRHENAVFKIDASRDREIAISCGVMGVPFVVFVENCKIVKAAPGVQRESAIEGFLRKKVARQSVGSAFRIKNSDLFICSSAALYLFSKFWSADHKRKIAGLIYTICGTSRWWRA